MNHHLPQPALLSVRGPVVFVPNRGPHDYSMAERYGPLIYCTEGNLDRWDVSQMAREVGESMKSSRPDDFVLLTSLSSLCSVTCATFAAKHGRLNLLIYRDGTYVQRAISFNQ